MITFSGLIKNLETTQNSEDHQKNTTQTPPSETTIGTTERTMNLMTTTKSKFILIEVYSVDSEEAMNNLDSLEGHPRWYCRTKVRTLSGDTVEVYDMPLEQTAHHPMTEEYLQSQYSHEDENNIYFNWKR